MPSRTLKKIYRSKKAVCPNYILEDSQYYNVMLSRINRVAYFYVYWYNR